MSCLEHLRIINKCGIIAIVRTDEAAGIVDAVDALRRGGVKAVEVTLNTPRALESIAKLRETYSEDMLIGAGTVLDAPSCVSAIRAGAEFIIAPGLNVEVIKAALRYGKIVIPGALTPTEVLAAYEAGAQAVKIFPAAQLGPGYIKQLKGPLNHIEMIPVGGVTLDNAEAFFKAGAFAVGVGNSLVDPALVKAGRFTELTAMAKMFVEVARTARG